MLCLGHTHFKNYVAWVTPAEFHYNNSSNPENAQRDYYLVSLMGVEKFSPLKQGEGMIYALTTRNLVKSPDFSFLFNLDKDYRPVKNITDMVQYNYYMDTKDFGGNLYKLSRENVIKFFEKLQQIDS